MPHLVTSLYQSYFGLAEAPFSIAPDPRYLYMSHRHQEALATLLYGLNGDGGFVLLTGEVGAGKTTVCRCLIEQIPESCDVAYIFNPRLTVVELLSTICDEFGIAYPSGNTSIKLFVDVINDYLLDAHAMGRNAVLIIDEAQNLSIEVLEQMRLLTNLETHQRKLLQIILLGQPELATMLERPELRQLAQRVVARYHLGPLTKAEVAAYVRHRLETSGAQRQLFPAALMSLVYRLSGGVPRVINVLCDRALLGTYVQGKERVDRATLAQAAREVFHQPTILRRRARWMLTASLVLLFGGLLAAVYRQEPWVSEMASVQRPANVKPATATARTKAGRAEKSDAAVVVSSDTAISVQPAVPASANNTATPVEKAKAVAPAEDADTAAALPDILQWPTNLPRAQSRAIAFTALLQAWGTDSRIEDPCRQAEGMGLRCRTSRGGLDELRKINRPAVLLMHDDQGQVFHATLIRLEEKAATFSFDTETRKVALGALALQWSGNYTLLWRMPPDAHENIRAGSRGPEVEWLSRQLAQMEGESSNASTDPVFDDALVRRVKQFQLSQGLIPDGAAGPQTLVRLSSMADQTAPKLFDGHGGG